MILAFWIITGIIGGLWLCAKFTPGMVRDLSYGDEVELTTCFLVLLLGVCAIMLGAFAGPLLPITYAAAIFLQRYLNKSLNQR